VLLLLVLTAYVGERSTWVHRSKRTTRLWTIASLFLWGSSALATLASVALLFS